MLFNQKKIRKTGSVNIPVAIRRELNIQPNDAVSVNISGRGVLITPLAPRCIFCDSQEHLGFISAKAICKDCARKALEMMEVEEVQSND